MQNVSNYAASNCNIQKMSGTVKSANKIENYVGILLQNPALCPGVPNQRGTQFAGPNLPHQGPNLQGPIYRDQSATALKSVGPNLPPNRRGA